MLIWLVTVGEPLPIDGKNERLLRAGLLANYLLVRGHEVVWWTSTFDHVRKKHRFSDDKTIEIQPGYSLKLLHGCGYKKNISPQRIFDHLLLAFKFKELAPAEPKPDVILCSVPPIELSLAVANFGKKNNVPVVIDMRDLWPEIFLEIFPAITRPFCKLLFAPFFHMLKLACKRATAISGVTEDFVHWGLSFANRPVSDFDKDFPFGYFKRNPSDNEIQIAEEFWKNLGFSSERNDFIICFFGFLGSQFDIETVINAARILKSQVPKVKFVICGTGENLERYRSLAQACDNMTFPGWIDANQIWTLMKISSAGLAPYRESKNFSKNLTNKPIEYLASGLPIFSSIHGNLEKLLKENNCGFTYQNGDPNGLVKEIINLFGNPKLRRIMVKNSYTLFCQKFDGNKVYGEMTNFLFNLSQVRKN